MNEVDKTDHSVDRILLIGGFSESKYIQKSIQEAFPDKLVITPESSDLCVLKGAVLFRTFPSAHISQGHALHIRNRNYNPI